MPTNPVNIAQRRPAETGTAALGIFVLALSEALNLSAPWLKVETAGVALAPFVITWVALARSSRKP